MVYLMVLMYKAVEYATLSVHEKKKKNLLGIW